MLVLTRKANEQILIGHSIVVTVLSAAHGKVRLGIEAPDAVRVLRGELLAHAVSTCPDFTPVGLELSPR